MAKGYFLSRSDLEELKGLLLPASIGDIGNVQRSLPQARKFSEALTNRLESHLSKQSFWRESGPIVMGTWARGQLSPKSDLDVLFIGETQAVMQAIAWFHQQGIRLRHRVPEQKSDWTVGVEFKDCLALYEAKALFEEQAVLLHQQQERLRTKGWQSSVRKFFKQEQLERNIRFDSMTNFLEPNLKQGRGGLRDLWQGKFALQIAIQSLDSDNYAKHLFSHYEDFFLLLRHRLHLDGYTDQLVASEQSDIGHWLGFEDSYEFMRKVQEGLSRVSFYSQWAIRGKVASGKITKPSGALRALQRNNAIEVQHSLRRRAPKVFKGLKQVERLSLLKRILNDNVKDEFVVALFHSRLMDHLFPRIRRLVGYVQHDQYHRYAADAHICQALRFTVRAAKDSKQLRGVFPKGILLKERDWSLLFWTALYHDIAKGLKGEHSELGATWALRDLSPVLGRVAAREVSWLVQNHLAISQTAFRKDILSAETKEQMEKIGITKDRLLRLAAFTMIDIQATNPEAWNDWKRELLRKFVAHALETWRLGSSSTKARTEAYVNSKPLLKQLDPNLLESVGAKALIKDLESLQKENSFRVEKLRGRTWIRFFSAQDRPGLLAEVLLKFLGLGISVEQAMIHTLDGLGVYDWFQVDSDKKTPLLNQWLNRQQSPVSIPKVKFSSIELIETDKSCLISFRGLNQAGLLYSAASAISDLGGIIISAKVHTWGRQVEDSFLVRYQGSPKDLLAALQARFP